MRGLTTESAVTVRYAETDQMGVAHHSVYPVWFEVARTDWIKALGTTYSQLEQQGVMLPLTQLQVSYLRPAHYEDELTVTASLARLTPARMVFAYRVEKRSAEGEVALLSEGTTLHAVVDSTTFRPCNLKKRMPTLYESLQSSLTDGIAGQDEGKGAR